MQIIYIFEQKLFLLKKMQQVCCKTEACRAAKKCGPGLLGFGGWDRADI